MKKKTLVVRKKKKKKTRNITNDNNRKMLSIMDYEFANHQYTHETLVRFADEEVIWFDAPQSTFQQEDVGCVLLLRPRVEKIDCIIH